MLLAGKDDPRGENEVIAYKIDPFAADVTLVDVDGLDDYYREIGCDTIDITVITVGGTQFNVVVDDEGLLRDARCVSVFDTFGTPMLVNTVLVFGMGEDGDLRSLNVGEVLQLGDETYAVTDDDGAESYVLVAS